MDRVTGALVLGLLAALACTAPAAAQDVSFTLFSPGDFNAFVKNWEPAQKPRCAVLQSEADWSKVMHAAPVMGASKPMSPNAGFWSVNAVLMVARVGGAGGKPDRQFQVAGLRRNGDALDLRYSFTAPPRGSSTSKYYLAVVTRKPLPREVHFIQGGELICSVAAR